MSSDIEAGSRGSTSVPVADAAFWVALVLAGPLILALNRDQWFFLDEWSFLVERDGGDLTSVITPHWGHCTILPVLLYRAIFSVAGLESYLPYQVPVVAAHLGLAAVLRALMRRCGVDPWLATTLATVFLFLGSGRSNLAWGFQITLSGSLLAGFAAVLLITPRRDGPGPVEAPLGRRRIAGAAALLVVSTLCSNVGVPMVAVAAAIAFLRFGWRTAALLAGPAAAVYTTWTLVAPESLDSVPPADARAALEFGGRVGGAALLGLTSWWPLAVVLVVLLAVSVVVAAARERPRLTDLSTLRGVPAMALVFALAVPAMALLLGWSRAGAPEDEPEASRYVYLLVALAVVPVGVALHALVRDRGRRTVMVASVFVLAWLPGNLAKVGPTSTPAEVERLGAPWEMPYLAEVAVGLGLEPDHEIAQGVTVGGLERLRESGDLEDPPDGIDDSRLRDLATVKAGLKFSDAILHGCERLPTSGPVELRPGQLLRALSDQRITLFRGGVATTASVTWRVESDAHDAIEVQVPLEVHIEPVDGDAAQLCAAAPAPRSP